MADVLSAPGPHGLAASRQQALGTRVIEHVDRSDLVQRPDPPDRQVGCLRGGQRLLEAERAAARSPNRSARPTISRAWQQVSAFTADDAATLSARRRARSVSSAANTISA